MNKAEGTGQRSKNRGPASARTRISLVCLSLAMVFLSSGAFAQDDALKLIETKRIEQQEKEEMLKKEEQRLSVIRKEVDEKIELYTKLLAKVEAAVKLIEQVKSDKLDNVVKAYESMPAEEAAVRLSVLDHDTALKIMVKMKSKKAGTT